MAESLILGSRRIQVVLILLLGGVWAVVYLELPLQLPDAGNLGITGEFFSRAWSPALDYESEVPAGTAPIWGKALAAAFKTVQFAIAAMSLAIVLGAVLGFAASSHLWLETSANQAGFHRMSVPGVCRGLVYILIRAMITLMRSVHELLWAVLFLAAFGFSQLSAVIALALPCAGILAKIFSELMDEAPQDAANALRAAGASPLKVYCFALLPAAAPDLLSYCLYRFECALRSSAILGFFGYPTLGYFIAASFENLYYGEVWTYLYCLFLLVVLADHGSRVLRKQLLDQT